MIPKEYTSTCRSRTSVRYSAHWAAEAMNWHHCSAEVQQRLCTPGAQLSQCFMEALCRPRMTAWQNRAECRLVCSGVFWLLSPGLNKCPSGHKGVFLRKPVDVTRPTCGDDLSTLRDACVREDSKACLC